MRTFTAIFFGLLYAVVCAFFAFIMTGAGHGWISPMIVSLGGFILFPLAFLCPAYRWNRTACAGVVAAFALASVFLILKTQSEGVRYFHHVGGLAYFWIAIWLLGQAPAIYGIVFPYQREVEDHYY